MAFYDILRNICTLFLNAKSSYKVTMSHFSSFCSHVNQFFTHTFYTMKIETLTIDFVAYEYSVFSSWENGQTSTISGYSSALIPKSDGEVTLASFYMAFLKLLE